jgi:site-specific DNA-methyltransferase (adenine-specific)
VHYELVHGDNRDVMRALAPASFDAIVCDPPYELGFMDKGWDKSGIAYDERVWKGALRCAKPGAYLLAFGGTRTFHRVMCAIEDAGWELRDTIMWVYGEGMPKGTDKAKIPEPWRGEWNTALKPAWEPIIVARAPMIGTLARNLQVLGTGAMNIEACRVPVDDAAYARNCSGDRGHDGTRSIDNTDATSMRTGGGSAASGRWPANLVHDGSNEVVALFPSEAGAQAPVHRRNGDKFRTTYGAFKGDIDEQGSTFQGDSGSAARFFYCAKTTRTDRNEGCEHLPRRAMNWSSGDQNPGSFQAEGTDRSSPNHHPTVKPTALMRWLCRLVTPRGGVILDHFAGSGSTGKAAMLEGFRFVGIDNTADYIEIARARIEFARGKAEQPS